jgi:hypothetical protein
MPHFRCASLVVLASVTLSKRGWTHERPQSDVVQLEKEKEEVEEAEGGGADIMITGTRFAKVIILN